MQMKVFASLEICFLPFALTVNNELQLFAGPNIKANLLTTGFQIFPNSIRYTYAKGHFMWVGEGFPED